LIRLIGVSKTALREDAKLAVMREGKISAADGLGRKQL